MGKSDNGRVVFYARQVCEFVERAADCVEPERQDEFLWHSRRATEAILLALLAVRGEPEPSAGEATLEKLRARLGELPQVPFDVRADLEAVRNNSNLGSHALLRSQSQSATSSTSPAAVGAKVRRHLPEVLRWARDQPVLGPMLDGRFDECAQRIATTSGRSRVQQAYADREQAQRESRQRFANGAAIGVLVGAAIGASAAALLLGVDRPRATRSSVQQQPRHPQTRPSEPHPSTPDHDPPPVTEADASDATSTARPVNSMDDQVRDRCPESAAFVPTSTLPALQAPSDRPYWPSRRQASALRVEAFCIDRHRVRSGDFARCVAAHGCSWLGGAETQDVEASRLVAAQAAAYCRWKGAESGLDGDLPSIVEWEALARILSPSESSAFEQTSLEFEWVHDAAYPALWSMRPEPGHRMTRKNRVRTTHGAQPQWSWNASNEALGTGTIGFRCRYRIARQ
jgi:hypothetical protein